MEPDLTQLFQAVTGVLSQNKEALNQADEYNHNHGDNMVEIFKTISQATQRKKSAEPADQLEYASRLLKKRVSSGSAAVYAEGLDEAATQVRGKPLNQNTMMTLITSLIGAGQAAQAPAQTAQDPLGGLLGSLMGGAVEQPAPQQQNPLGGLLGSLMGGAMEEPAPQQQNPLGGLLGSLMGGAMEEPAPQQQNPLGGLLGSLMGGAVEEPAPQQQGGINMANLLQAAMVFMQSQQGGASTVESLLAALMANSKLANSAHRKQSGTLVVNTLLQMMAKATAK